MHGVEPRLARSLFLLRLFPPLCCVVTLLLICYHDNRANISSSVATQQTQPYVAGTGFLQAEGQHNEIAVTEVLLLMCQQSSLPKAGFYASVD